MVSANHAIAPPTPGTLRLCYATRRCGLGLRIGLCLCSRISKSSRLETYGVHFQNPTAPKAAERIISVELRTMTPLSNAGLRGAAFLGPARRSARTVDN